MGEGSRFGAVLFDLDGTLVETRRDIATGVNLALASRGFGPLTVEQVSRHVGSGARFLVTRCLEECGVASPEPEEVERLYRDFHAQYLAHLLDTTYVYPGMSELCERLMSAGVAMGVVTNKPIEPSRRILTGFGLNRLFPVVLGGESLSVRKPDPAPLHHALAALGIGTERAAMVGDSEIDIGAARAAGCAVAAVTWGFVPKERLASFAPDLLADTVGELSAWILV